ncbi:MAG: class I SAM-dependent methyltransferase [Nitrospira sp.]|nr:class I SAM-dependent methyltransferase [Nitrospira sp.]
MSHAQNSYTLLDSGNFRKLEQVGPYRLNRPAPQAIWNPALTEIKWADTHAYYHRSSSGGGKWEYKSKLPENWTINYHGMTMKIKLTDFGHLGLFPEQGPNWDWIKDQIRKADRPVKVLNTFAYTGGSSLAAAAAGAEVVHLDAAKGMEIWARENAKLSKMDNLPIRWLVDDVTKFINREIRRGNRYDAIIMDPPSFGRGSNGEVWKFEDNLPSLLELCSQIISPEPVFMLLSAHTPGITPLTLENLLADLTGPFSGTMSSSEMIIPEQSSKRVLPSGTMARWYNGVK